MRSNKNIQLEKEASLNQKQHKKDNKNEVIKEADNLETDMKNTDLKPTIKISKNIHIKPAEEQQFENNF